MSPNKINNILGIPKMKNFKQVLRQLLSEFLGTFLYLALVLSASVGYTNKDVDTGNRVIVIALANGLLIASVVAIFGHISGGHINPAVTLGALVCKHIKPLKAICYILVQIAGSIAGAAVAYVISSESIRGNLGATIPYGDLRVIQIITLEFLMTFVLVAVVLSVTDTYRGARGLGSAPLAIGLSITACICACSPYTASLNPIRSLGPAIVMGIWYNHWAYWLGPMAGGLAAGLVYRFLLYYHCEIYIPALAPNVPRSSSNVQKT